MTQLSVESRDISRTSASIPAASTAASLPASDARALGSAAPAAPASGASQSDDSKSKLVQELLRTLQAATKGLDVQVEVSSSQAARPTEKVLGDDDLHNPAELAQKLGRLLEAASQDPAQAQAVEKTFSRLSAALDKLVTNGSLGETRTPELTQVREALKQLQAVLEERGGAGPISAEDLETVLRGQQTLSANSTQRLKDILTTIGTSSTVQDLELVLRGIEQNLPQPITGKEKEFSAFVTSLLQNLSDLQKAGAPDEDFRALLKSAYQTLKNEFSETDGGTAGNTGAPTSNPFSPQFASVAQRLERILQSVLETPPGYLTESQLNETLELITGSTTGATAPITDSDLELLQQLRSLQQTLATPLEDAEYSVHSKAVETLAFLQQLATGDSSNVSVTSTAAGADAARKALLDSISKLESVPPAVPGLSSSALESLLHDPAVAKLTATLAAVTDRDLANFNASEKQLVMFARQLAQSPLAEAAKDTIVTRDQLRGALAEFRLVSDSVQSSLALTQVKNQEKVSQAALEQIGQGYAAANALAPLMESMGVPATFILPTFLGGLFSDLQIEFGHHDGDRFVEPEAKRHGRRGSSQSEYQRTQFSIHLKELGLVVVDVSLKKPAITIRITAQSSSVATIDAQQSGLESALRACGFSACAISVRASPDAFHAHANAFV